MEEDLKILEQFEEFLKTIRIPSCNFEKEIQAISNLIESYKNLQQIEEHHKKENGELRERVKELEEKLTTIQEKIEKTRIYISEYMGEFVAIEDIQGLLGGK